MAAGDLNQDLRGQHYYGSTECRALLTDQMAKAGLTCLTATDRFDPGILQHPPLDHVCASAVGESLFTTTTHGWINVIDGVTLSDHGGTLVSFEMNRTSHCGQPIGYG